jgi:plasmid maintenance system antidote protein VapI
MSSGAVHEPITPGEILRTEFLKPMSISQSRLARATGFQIDYELEVVRTQRPDALAKVSPLVAL